MNIGVDPMSEYCRPLAVEVSRIMDAGVPEEWKPPKPLEYRRLHGTGDPTLSE